MSLMNLRYRNEAAVQLHPAAPSGSGSSCSSSSASSSVQPPCIGGGHSGVEGPGLSAMQRSLYCLGAVVLRYAWGRLGQYAAGQHWGDSAGGSSGGSSSFSWRQRGWQLMRQAESGYRLASLLNFLAFLRSGRYRWEPMHCAPLECCVFLSASELHLTCGLSSPCCRRFASRCPLRCRSLLDRLLRARLVYQQPSAARAISFEYLNRQLVWSELR